MRTQRGAPNGRTWWRGLDLNQRPLGYEPNELPDCSTPLERAYQLATGLRPGLVCSYHFISLNAIWVLILGVVGAFSAPTDGRSGLWHAGTGNHGRGWDTTPRSVGIWRAAACWASSA